MKEPNLERKLDLYSLQHSVPISFQGFEIETLKFHHSIFVVCK